MPQQYAKYRYYLDQLTGLSGFFTVDLTKSVLCFKGCLNALTSALFTHTKVATSLFRFDNVLFMH